MCGLGKRAACPKGCPTLDSLSLDDQIHALLFVAESPVTPEDMAALLGTPQHAVEECLARLSRQFAVSGPLQLVRLAGGYQMATKPIFATLVAQFLQPQPQRMSRSLLEVLAVVAYQQPMTSHEIDQIRGVDSAYAIRQLVDRRLIGEVGRKSAPGRPILYGTTQHFLHVFQLNDLDDLPTIEGLDHPIRGDGEHLPLENLPEEAGNAEPEGVS